MDDLTDKAIVTKIQSPDERDNDEAFEILYEQYYESIEGYIKRNSGTERDAEDMFQDALIVFFHQVKKGDFNLDCSIQTYLYSVCRNLWLKVLRDEKRPLELTEEHEFIAIDESHTKILVQNEQTAILMQMIGQLGEECRQILVHFYFNRLRMKDIVRKVGLASEQVAKNKKMRCMKRLKEMAKGSTLFNDFFA